MLARRIFLSSSLAGLAALGVGMQASLREAETLTLEQFSLEVPSWGEDTPPLRLVALSDFHLQPFTTLRFLREAVEAASFLQPDLVVLLGDFVDSSVEAIDDLAPLLATLKSRMGVFATLGNHDHHKGASYVDEALRRQGIEVLLNRSVSLSYEGRALNLAGVDSLSGRPDMEGALKALPTGGANLLLAHEPDVADLAARDGRVCLQLSGHSHGGQVRLTSWPLQARLLPAGARKYPYGSYGVGNMRLHTSRGLGTTAIPLRWGSPPEITLIRLVPRIRGRKDG